jgi:hypothetical protein
MLMRDQDRVQLFGIFVDGGEPGENVAFAKAGVDQDARSFGADESRISRTAAGENADLDYDGPPLLDRAQRSGPRSVASLGERVPRCALRRDRSVEEPIQIVDFTRAAIRVFIHFGGPQAHGHALTMAAR